MATIYDELVPELSKHHDPTLDQSWFRGAYGLRFQGSQSGRIGPDHPSEAQEDDQQEEQGDRPVVWPKEELRP
jgi:hypothetical protein